VSDTENTKPMSRGKTPERQAYNKAWREANKDRIAARNATPEWKAYRAALARARRLTPNGKADEALRRKNYYAQNREMYLRKTKEWRDANPDRVATSLRKSQLLKRYNLTPDMFNEMLGISDGRCYICGDVLARLTKEFPCIDHCHQTGVIRGILCSRCNRMLGLARDNPEILQNAVKYLNSESACQTKSVPA